MADFLTNLWTSVFTPGPTPTLVHATNISFAALQTILLALLIATFSIHFIILSFLCAGLWIGVNWFVRELEEANRREEGKKHELERHKREHGSVETGSEGDDEEDTGVGSGSGTETEEVRNAPAERLTDHGKVGTASGVAESLQLGKSEADVRKRRSIGEGSSAGDMSTDSEWDKIEEAGEIKR